MDAEPKKLAFLSMKDGGASLADPGDAPPAPEEGMEVAAEAAMAAMKSGDAKAFLGAIRDIFTMMEAAPHSEPGENEAA